MAKICYFSSIHYSISLFVDLIGVVEKMHRHTEWQRVVVWVPQ